MTRRRSYWISVAIMGVTLWACPALAQSAPAPRESREPAADHERAEPASHAEHGGIDRDRPDRGDSAEHSYTVPDNAHGDHIGGYMPAGPFSPDRITASQFARSVFGSGEAAAGANAWISVSMIGEGTPAPSQYYMLPQGMCSNHFIASAAATQGCLAFVLQNAARFGYGPSPFGNQLWLRAGDNYYILPVCGPVARWEHNRLVSPTRTTSELKVRCP